MQFHTKRNWEELLDEAILIVNLLVAFYSYENEQPKTHKIYVQSNTDIPLLIVHHSLWCYIDGGSKSEYYLMRNFSNIFYQGNLNEYTVTLKLEKKNPQDTSYWIM